MRKNLKGSISVFLSLLLSAVLILSLTLLESARVSGAIAAAKMAGNAAADSLMAGYDRALFDEYGILFYDSSFGSGLTDYDALEEEFEGYFMANMKSRSILTGGSFFSASGAESRVTELVSATDYNGEVFMRACLDGFKYDLAGSLLEDIREKLGLVDKSEAAREKTEKKKDKQKKTDWGTIGTEDDAAPMSYRPSDVRSASDAPATLMDLRFPTAEEAASLYRVAADMRQRAERTRLIQGAPGASPDTEDTGEEQAPFDEDRYEDAVENSVIGGRETIEAKGWLNLVLPKGTALSGITFSSGDLPSEATRDPRTLREDGFFEDLLQKTAFGEYLLQTFPSFTEGTEKEGLKYEPEYLIAGKQSDEKNLKSVLTRILLIREGMNLMYLLTSKAKTAEAEAMAELLFSWTGIPILVILAKYSILAAWAYAESILDVRTLLEGERSPFVKDDKSWCLSLSGTTNFLRGEETAGRPDDRGMSYNDYLRLLLFLTDVHDASYRAMDLIQLNMELRSPGFRMCSQAFAMEIETEVSVPKLFAALPIVRREIAKFGGFSWTETNVVSY